MLSLQLNFGTPTVLCDMITFNPFRKELRKADTQNRRHLVVAMTDQSVDINVYVDQNFQSIVDLEGLVQQYTRDSPPVANVFKAGSWELFDKVYAMSANGSISNEQQAILLEATRLICIHARPREVLLMVLEKISCCSDVFPFQLLIHATILLIANSNDLAVWKQG